MQGSHLQYIPPPLWYVCLGHPLPQDYYCSRRQGLSPILSLCLGWLAGEPLGSSCLCLPCAEIKVHATRSSCFMWDLKIKLRFLCLLSSTLQSEPSSAQSLSPQHILKRLPLSPVRELPAGLSCVCRGHLCP